MISHLICVSESLSRKWGTRSRLVQCLLAQDVLNAVESSNLAYYFSLSSLIAIDTLLIKFYLLVTV